MCAISEDTDAHNPWNMAKATAIDPSVVDADGVYRHTGAARVFTSEKAAMAAIAAIIKANEGEQDRHNP